MEMALFIHIQVKAILEFPAPNSVERGAMDPNGCPSNKNIWIYVSR